MDWTGLLREELQPTYSTTEELVEASQHRPLGDVIYVKLDRHRRATVITSPDTSGACPLDEK